MSFVGDLARARTELRAAAESRMTSRVTIRRRRVTDDGSPVWVDVEGGYEAQAWDDVHVDLPLRLGAQRGATTYRKESVGGTDVEVATLTAHMPAGTLLVDGDLLDVTSGEAVGRVLEVLESTVGEQATATRVPVIEISRPKEW